MSSLLAHLAGEGLYSCLMVAQFQQKTGDVLHGFEFLQKRGPPTHELVAPDSQLLSERLAVLVLSAASALSK